VNAGFYVTRGRVDDNLSLSRAIGDHKYKKNEKLTPQEQCITAFPEVMIKRIREDDEVIVIACDGIWDCMSSEEVVKHVRSKLTEIEETREVRQTADRDNGGAALDQRPEGTKLSRICEGLFPECLCEDPEKRGSATDNMTLMIVQLGPRIRTLRADTRPNTEIRGDYRIAALFPIRYTEASDCGDHMQPHASDCGDHMQPHASGCRHNVGGHYRRRRGSTRLTRRRIFSKFPRKGNRPRETLSQAAADCP